jgi:hypothetical protein
MMKSEEIYNGRKEYDGWYHIHWIRFLVRAVYLV